MPSAPRTPAPLERRLVELAFAALVVYAWVAGRPTGSGAPTGATQERAAGIRFREVARDVGVDFVHRRTRVDPQVANIEAHITAVGAAVSIADANGDGWPDLYATTSADGAANALFVNRRDGTFDEVAAAAGLADLNREGAGVSMGSVWADYDNDGRQDVFVYKWGRSQLLRNLGDLRFEDVTRAAGLGRWTNSNAATWLDFDRDGHLDLFVAGYFDEAHDLWDLRTTRIMHDSFEFASNGGRNWLYRNRGDGTFDEVGEEVGLASRRWTYAAVAADFDRDGWQDLYVANDYGSEELFLNRAGTFELARGLGLERESKSGMSVALGDVGNEGQLAVYVTNISRRGYLFQGNNLRVSFVDRGGPMLQLAEGAVQDCGWAWGAQFGDLDGDGYQDLVVVNGFLSASRERDYWYQMSKIGIGLGTVVEDAASWPPFEDRSLSGYERTRVLLNLGRRGGRSFVEVGQEVGIDDVHDGRAVALGDLDRDGDLDVVVANQKGPLLVYRNDTELDHRWIAFELVGTRSNRDALGAELVLEFAGGEQAQVVTAAAGFAAQNERRLFFGLGAEPGPLRARVRWPSGLEEVLEDLRPGTVHRLVEEEG